jgi:branched-chain amino acid transport system ATP-binding protein
MNRIVLDVQNLTKSFGGVVANDQVSFQVEEGEIIGIIGPNGAGKTTLFNMISAVKPEGVASQFPDSGQVFFKGQKITGLLPNEICKLGLARTFQIVKTMKNMTIFDNVMIGSLNRTHRVPQAKDITREILEFTHLWNLRRNQAGSVPIASQKRVEIARALATQPVLLMLDEPMAGLTPKEVEEAVELVKTIHQREITVILVEHVMKGVMPIADRMIVLDNGKTIAVDTPLKIVEDERVKKAYFGEST